MNNANKTTKTSDFLLKSYEYKLCDF